MNDEQREDTPRPRKLDGAIAHRLTIAREDAETMRAKADYLGMAGGPHGVFTHCEFHDGRVRLLEWMETASAADIDAKRLQLESELGPAVQFKGGSMIGLPDEVVTQIAHLELLEYALGLHAHQQKRAERT